MTPHTVRCSTPPYPNLFYTIKIAASQHLLSFLFVLTRSGRKEIKMENKHITSQFDACALAHCQFPDIVTDRDDAFHYNDDPHHFESWYFDVHTDDEYKMAVLVLYRDWIGMFGDLDKPATPGICLNVETPDGDKRDIVRSYPDLKLEADYEQCDFKLGNIAWCKGKYPNWHLHIEEDDVVLDVNLMATMPSWKPGTGTMYYNEKLTEYSSHFVAVPCAIADGTLTVAGKTKEFKNGHGYHDHNFGNVVPMSTYYRWHWGRAEVDDFILNFSHVIAPKEYDFQVLPQLLLSKGDQILLSTGTFTDTYTDTDNISVSSITRTPYPNVIKIEVPYNNDHVKIVISNQTELADNDLIPNVPLPSEMRKPGYIRLMCDVEISIPLLEGIKVVKGKMIHELGDLREPSVVELK